MSVAPARAKAAVARLRHADRSLRSRAVVGPARVSREVSRHVTGLTDSIVGAAHTRDGVELRTLQWPAAATPRAHLLLIHGIAEHAGRHAHLASHFRSEEHTPELQP